MNHQFKVLLSLNKTEFRYKVLRAAQNRRAYLRNRERKHIPSDNFPLPSIPPIMKKLASFPLPLESYLFRDIAASPAFECSDFNDARLEDLSQVTMGTGVPLSLDDEAALCAALHGWHLRQQRDYEDARLPRHRALPPNTFLQEIHAEMLQFQREWDELGGLLHASSSHADLVGSKIAWQWKARRFCNLYEDIQAVKEGSGVFLNVYVDRWSTLRY